ncbi:MAG: hypothetical protein IT335_15915, partial [Thermomicrobiales bacterium]|nr:hypothetical protein [Thermomicrobiales bacterium]
QACREEIINEREVRRDGMVLCRPCAGQSYYRLADDPAHADDLPMGEGTRLTIAEIALAAQH